MPPARRSARNVSTTAARDSAHPYTRANRQASPTSSRPPAPGAHLTRPANGKTSLRLTVKAAPSKLRQATSGSQVDATIPPNPYADIASESDATPAPAVRTARSTRNPRTVVEPESEEESEPESDEGLLDQDDDQGDALDLEIESEDAESESEDDGGDSDQDAEGDLDEDMSDAIDDHPPPPIITTSHPLSKGKPNVTVTAPDEGPLKSVEAKEMDDLEDEELSELDSNENDDDDLDESSNSDSDDEGSRGATPDLSKLTRRQRGFYEDTDSALLSLSNEAQKKKHLTAEEHAMRRAEMARRRKNLSEKRNEEEKMDTINKLLKKPAPKRRTRAEMLAAQHAGSMATPGAEEDDEERADPLWVRWVQSKQGSRLGVPDEWMEMDGSVGQVFRTGWSGRMVEEVA